MVLQITCNEQAYAVSQKPVEMDSLQILNEV